MCLSVSSQRFADINIMHLEIGMHFLFFLFCMLKLLRIALQLYFPGMIKRLDRLVCLLRLLDVSSAHYSDTNKNYLYNVIGAFSNLLINSLLEIT